MLKQITNDISRFAPDGRRSNREPEIEDNEVSIDFRHLGNWIDDEERHGYDDEDEGWREDNDQRIWATGEYKKYAKMWKEFISGFPWKKYVELGLHEGEKDWCYFIVHLKKTKNESVELKEDSAGESNLTKDIKVRGLDGKDHLLKKGAWFRDESNGWTHIFVFNGGIRVLADNMPDDSYDTFRI